MNGVLTRMVRAYGDGVGDWTLISVNDGSRICRASTSVYRRCRRNNGAAMFGGNGDNSARVGMARVFGALHSPHYLRAPRTMAASARGLRRSRAHARIALSSGRAPPPPHLPAAWRSPASHPPVRAALLHQQRLARCTPRHRARRVASRRTRIIALRRRLCGSVVYRANGSAAWHLRACALS